MRFVTYSLFLGLLLWACGDDTGGMPGVGSAAVSEGSSASDGTQGDSRGDGGSTQDSGTSGNATDSPALGCDGLAVSEIGLIFYQALTEDAQIVAANDVTISFARLGQEAIAAELVHMGMIASPEDLIGQQVDLSRGESGLQAFWERVVFDDREFVVLQGTADRTYDGIDLARGQSVCVAAERCYDAEHFLLSVSTGAINEHLAFGESVTLEDGTTLTSLGNNDVSLRSSADCGETFYPSGMRVWLERPPQT